jgi:hypothetical protein
MFWEECASVSTPASCASHVLHTWMHSKEVHILECAWMRYREVPFLGCRCKRGWYLGAHMWTRSREVDILECTWTCSWEVDILKCMQNSLEKLTSWSVMQRALEKLMHTNVFSRSWHLENIFVEIQRLYILICPSSPLNVVINIS